MTNEEVDLASLEAKVSAVASQTEELDAAITEERAQRAALVDAVMRMAKPALRAVVSRIKVYSHSEGEQGPTTEKHHSMKGLRLDGTKGPDRDNPNERGGSYEGWDTYWLMDGSLLDLKYGGDWSAYQTESCHWEAEATVIAPDEAAAHLVDTDLDQKAIKVIMDALDSQLTGNAPKRIEQARERATRLKAIVALAI